MNRMYSPLLLLMGACFLLGFTQVPPYSQDSILGIYWTPERDAKVEIYERAGHYYGKVIWTKYPGLTDKKNPNASLRTRPLRGTDIFMHLTYNAKENIYDNGILYNTSNGKSYDCELWLDTNSNLLKVRGFVGHPYFGETYEFSKIQ